MRTKIKGYDGAATGKPVFCMAAPILLLFIF